MKCLFMYNPHSGKGVINKSVSYIMEKLLGIYSHVDVFCTKKPLDMAGKAARACGVYDILIFAGGDGSFNEVLSGIAGKEKRPILGYIPAGTVNDIARALKIPRTVKGALKNIVNGQAASFDIMKVNDRYAMYCVCAGAFTSASYIAPQREKRVLGRIAYGLQGIRKNMRFDTFNIKLTAGEELYNTDTVFVLVMNGKSVAGFKINGGGSMDDGVLEAVIVKQQKNPGFFKRIKAFFKVLKVFIVGYNKLREKDIQRIEGAKFKFETDDEIVWNFDGEKGVCGTIDISVIPRHIQVITPLKK